MRIVPKENFDGYPAGKRVSFVTGVAADVPDAFAELAIAKGQAEEDRRAADVAPKKGAKREAE